MDLAQKPVYKLDLAAGTSVVNLTTPLVEGDDRAQTFTLELTDKGAPANLNGYSVTAYFGRGKTAEAEADTIPLSGTVSGNVATITLTESCYSRSCYFSMPIRLSNGATGQKRTYLIVRGTVVKSVDGKIIDPDGSVPSLDDLFAQIAVMERSRQAAEEATEEALAAAARADETREGIQDDLATLTEDIANQIPFTTYCYNAHFIKGKALGTGINDVGSKLTQLPYDSVRSYISIDCSEGDVFDVCGENSSEARLWCFLDAQDVILSRIRSYEGEAAERIVAPENTSRLVVNTNFSTVPDSYVVKISAREIEVDEQFDAAAKNTATLAFESLLLENGSINYDGSLSPSNERVRTMEYIHGKQSIKCPDGIVCRFIIYYNADTLEYDSCITSDSAFFEVGKDGCVAKLTFMRSGGGELYVDDLRDGLVEKTINNVGKWLPNSPYWRDKNFGCVPAEYYKGIGSSYEDGFGRGTEYADYIAKWKALIGSHAAYVKETELGAASDGQKVYMYDFKPVRIADAQKDIPKIIIVGGQHGFEKSSVFGLYYFVENLLTKWAESPALSYLRNHVELMIVPVLNTYGFDNFVYKNANGVNLNRNYDCNWGLIADTTSSDYGGAAPFDQPESRMIRDLVLANKDAVLVIDFHTNGGSSVANYSDITFYGITPSDDRYYNRMLDVFDCHIADISAHFNHDYSLEHPDTAFGYLAIEVGTGQMRGWVTDNNVIGIVAEGFNGFPGEAEYVPNVYRANEEIIVNLLAKTMKYLQEVAY